MFRTGPPDGEAAVAEDTSDPVAIRITHIKRHRDRKGTDMLPPILGNLRMMRTIHTTNIRSSLARGVCRPRTCSNAPAVMHP